MARCLPEAWHTRQARYGPYSQHYNYDVWGNLTSRAGWGGANASFTATYDNKNQRAGLTYDTAGNLTNDGGQAFQYDATGQQTVAGSSGYTLTQGYDGDGLRVQKTEQGATTYYVRSTVLGGQVMAEVGSGGVWQRGYVYVGSQLLAVQADASVRWVHADPAVKSQRMTNTNGNVVVTVVELDPWGGDTLRSWQQGQQPQRYTSYLGSLVVKHILTSAKLLKCKS